MTQVGHDRLIAKQRRFADELDALVGRDKSSSRGGGLDGNIQNNSDGCEHDEWRLRAQIKEIDLIFEDGVTIVPAAKKTERVQIGQVITISMDDGQVAKTRQLWIDGYAETEPDFMPQVVGYYAPLIKALIGRRQGEAVEVMLTDDAGGKMVYDVRILRIELPTEAQITQHIKKKAA